MQYNFDEVIDRAGTYSIKYDVVPPNAAKDLLPMWIADMDFPCAQPIIDALHNRIDHRIFGYSNYFFPDAKQPVIDWFQRRFGWNIDMNDIVYSPGVVPAISFLLHILTVPGDGVIVQQPVYYPFANMIAARGCTVVNNQLRYENGAYTMDYTDLEAKMADPANKGMILCSPHNPVGRVWTEEELKQVVAIAQKYDKWIISDEIHCDLIRTGYTHIPLLKLCPEYKHRIIACTAPSKTFNMAGMQMSNIIIPNEEYRQKWFGYTMGELSISSPSPFGIVAMHAAYNEGEDWLNQVNAYLDENVAFMKAYLAEHLPEAHMAESQGTYLVWVDVNAYCSDAKELERLMLEEAGVYFDEGYIFGPGGSGFERFNIACPRSILEKSLERMSTVLKKYAGK